MINLINKVLAFTGHKIVKTEEQIDYRTEPLILGEWLQYDWKCGIYDSGYGADSYIFDSIRNTVPCGVVEIGKPRYNCTKIKLNFDGFGSHEIRHGREIQTQNINTGDTIAWGAIESCETPTSGCKFHTAGARTDAGREAGAAHSADEYPTATPGPGGNPIS